MNFSILVYASSLDIELKKCFSKNLKRDLWFIFDGGGWPRWWWGSRGADEEKVFANTDFIIENIYLKRKSQASSILGLLWISRYIQLLMHWIIRYYRFIFSSLKKKIIPLENTESKFCFWFLKKNKTKNYLCERKLFACSFFFPFSYSVRDNTNGAWPA